MLWHEVTVLTTEEAVEAVSHHMHELGAGGVSIEESFVGKKRNTALGEWYDELPLSRIPPGQAVVTGYFAESADVAALVRELKERLGKLAEFGLDPGEAKVDTALVDEEDWANAWKRYFKPVRITRTLTVKPTWETCTPSPGERVIEIDPGMAFGTGTHPTTALCLRTLEEVIQGGEEVIDVGTGSGILAIGACLLGASRVLALDLDPVAVSSARENAKLNGLAERIVVKESDLLQIIRLGEQQDAADRFPHTGAADPLGIRLPVQIVCANILADVILKFIDDVYRVLSPGGIYIASGIYKNKEQDVQEALIRSGFSVDRISREEDWAAIVAVKR